MTVVVHTKQLHLRNSSSADRIVGVDIALSTAEQLFLDDNVVTGESW